ncbi:MAG: hypothetical protein ABIK42_00545 [candidate division WOR-3 bacterium]
MATVVKKGLFSEPLRRLLLATRAISIIDKLHSGQPLTDGDKKHLRSVIEFLNRSASSHKFVLHLQRSETPERGLRDYLWFLRGVGGMENASDIDIDKICRRWINALENQPVNLDDLNGLRKFFQAITDAALSETAPQPEHIGFY